MIYGSLHSTDKRENLRKNLGGRIIINHPPNTPSVISAWIQNISVGGVRVKIEIPASPIQKGDEVRFIINEDYFRLEGEGEIVWSSPAEAAVGIKFNQLAEEMRSCFEQFLRLLT
jgi:hypothetical protein